MRTGALAIAVVVVGVAAWAGVGFACGGGPSNTALIWVNPTGSPTPAAHTFIHCSESGKNTPNLVLSASNLGPGDGCAFAADLANTGQQGLEISETTVESTPHGAPTFITCFSFTVSSGPPSGEIPGGGDYPYTFSVGMLGSAPSGCQKASGTVELTFSGQAACSHSGWGSPPIGKRLGPNVNLADADLADMNLAGMDLAGDNLQGADLSCGYFHGTNFGGANLGGANLTGGDFTGAYFVNCGFVGANLEGATLTAADFQGADVEDGTFQGAIVTGLTGEPTDFNSANLEYLNLEGVSATGALTAVGAKTTGGLNVASCALTSGTATYCNEL